MGFNAPPGEQAGQRVFDIKLQDKLVLESFEIAATAGAANKAVIKEFNGIQAGSRLVVELLAKAANPQAGQAPIINFIEVIKEEELSPQCPKKVGQTQQLANKLLGDIHKNPIPLGH